MTTFEDGPAKGKALGLKRTPIFLRVVQGRDGTWDALDQLGDTAAAGETVYVYFLVRKDGDVHVCTRGKGGGGWYGLATYKLYHTQPPQETLLSNMAWADWVRGEVEKEKVQNAH